MEDFPEKTCSIDRLVTHDKLIASALDGSKTEQRRAGVYGYPGEEFDLNGVTFVMKDLSLESLGQMTELDAKREGYQNLDAYRDLILRMHPGMVWDDGATVWVHRFAKAE